MTTSAESPEQHLQAPWRSALSRPEIDSLLTMQDWRTAVSIGINWAIVLAALACVQYWTNPLTIVAALFIIGARQLGFAVLMHEASHRSLLSDRRWNDWVGNWLCAYPIWSDLTPYRPYHLKHHARTGAPEDPDIGLIKPFPITPASFRRKVWRDLSGQTGIKFAQAAWHRTFGQWRTDPVAKSAARGFAITNLLLLVILSTWGSPALYLLWAGAWLTTHTLVTRIRSIAEHALTPDPADPLGNTRTTLARGWERLLIAPNRVNYHIEHHLLMTVPHYALPRMNRILQERGILDRACVSRGYWEVLRNATSGKPGGTTPSDGSPEIELSHVNGL